MDQLLSDEDIERFASQLVKDGLLSRQQAEDAVEQSRKTNIPFIHHLEEKKMLDARTAAHMLSRFFSIPLYDLDVHEESFIPKEFINLNVVSKGYGLPLIRRNDAVAIAVADPSTKALQEVSPVTGLKLNIVLVEGNKLTKMIERVCGAKGSRSITDLSEGEFSDFEVSPFEDDSKEDAITYNINDTPVVRFVNKVLIDAIRSKSSDIHFEPYERSCRVRYRKDGILYEVANPPKALANSIVARLKVMARLDISEHRVPQDGRFKLSLGYGESMDFRMSVCPTLYGEKIVMRILDKADDTLDVNLLGMGEVQQKQFLDAIKMSQGMVLVTGPTGSGKTVTLYSAIRVLNTPEKNISTIEDPVEINMEGINQVQVNAKVDMTFSNALRSFLRQDPDIMMVGEIRDLETAEIAIKAAQTGHMVLSTLHTNSAPETLARLSSMGVKPFNIASSVSLVIAQRLVRKLCSHCKRSLSQAQRALLEDEFKNNELGDAELYGPSACKECTQGYKGRIGIYEVMPISDAMRHIILEGGNAMQLAEQAHKEGVLNLREAALEKVKQGLTSIEELHRVTG